MNTIHVNYMTRTFGSLWEYPDRAKHSGKNMAEAIADAARKTAEAQEPERAQESRPAERTLIEAMTMEEYKEYIRERILSIPMHASHMQDTISVHISEEGFAAMKKDAAYEEWVLNDLRAGWTWENPWARYMGGAFSVIHYGASKEESHAEMWNAGFRHGDGKGLLESMSGDDDDKDDQKRKSEIVVRPDGTRYLVISEIIAGMKITVMSLRISEPDELAQNGAEPETGMSAPQTSAFGAAPVS